MDDKDLGASLRDRAGGTDAPEPPTASQPKALIPSAALGALPVAFKQAFGFSIGKWEAEGVLLAMHDLGYAFVPLGSSLEAEALFRREDGQFRTAVRVNARVMPRSVGAFGQITDQLLGNKQYVAAFSDDLAQKALQPYWRELGARIAQAIEARRAETLGSVHESAVGETDAPDAKVLNNDR